MSLESEIRREMERTAAQQASGTEDVDAAFAMTGAAGRKVPKPRRKVISSAGRKPPAATTGRGGRVKPPTAS